MDGRDVADSHLSFGEQALHYFRRPHESVAREPLRGPAAWRGAELARREDWIVRLEPGQIDELERARAGARAEGLSLETLSREAFPLPTLAPAVAGWRRELRDGRGFLLLRGLPVRDWGEQEASQTSFMIAPGELPPGETKVEILVREASHNQTATESCFEVQ